MPPPNVSVSVSVGSASSLWVEFLGSFTANEPLEVAAIAALEGRDLLAVDVGSYGRKRLWGRTTHWDGRCVYVVDLNDEVVTTTATLGDAVRQYNDIEHAPKSNGDIK